MDRVLQEDLLPLLLERCLWRSPQSGVAEIHSSMVPQFQLQTDVEYTGRLVRVTVTTVLLVTWVMLMETAS